MAMQAQLYACQAIHFVIRHCQVHKEEVASLQPTQPPKPDQCSAAIVLNAIVPAPVSFLSSTIQSLRAHLSAQLDLGLFDLSLALLQAVAQVADPCASLPQLPGHQ